MCTFLAKERLQNIGKDCWSECNHQSGPCAWCGSEGLCCQKGTEENGCDGFIGGESHRHECVAEGTDINVTP